MSTFFDLPPYRAPNAHAPVSPPAAYPSESYVDTRSFRRAHPEYFTRPPVSPPAASPFYHVDTRSFRRAPPEYEPHPPVSPPAAYPSHVDTRRFRRAPPDFRHASPDFVTPPSSRYPPTVARTTRVYYDDDDPYAPRTGPAAMPSPRWEHAPHYSGRGNSFEDFLEEFEGRACDCELTDPQRVEQLSRYVDPSLHDLCKSLNGYRSHDWPSYRQSLIHTFGNTTPRHLVMRQKLLSLVQNSSGKRMDGVDDVIQYYRDFLCYSAPLVHTGHLSEEERDVAFWCGFHPYDRDVLQPRLLAINPFQPREVPFHFEDVYSCARGAFAYDGFFPPGSYVKQFEPSSMRRERPVASNTETPATISELPSPSQLTPVPQLSPSSLVTSESQHAPAHPATDDQPESEPAPAPTSSTPLSRTPSPALFDAGNAVPAPPVMSSSPLPALLPSLAPTAPTPSRTPAPALSDAVNVPSLAPAPPVLSSISPSALLISTSPAHASIGNGPELTPPPPSSPTSAIELESPSSPSLSTTDDQPETEPVLASTPPTPAKPEPPPPAARQEPIPLPRVVDSTIVPLPTFHLPSISNPSLPVHTSSPHSPLVDSSSYLAFFIFTIIVSLSSVESSTSSLASPDSPLPQRPPGVTVVSSFSPPLEVSPRAPVSSHPPLPQRPPGVTSATSRFSPLAPFASLVSPVLLDSPPPQRPLGVTPGGSPLSASPPLASLASPVSFDSPPPQRLLEVAPVGSVSAPFDVQLAAPVAPITPALQRPIGVTQFGSAFTQPPHAPSSQRPNGVTRDGTQRTPQWQLYLEYQEPSSQVSTRQRQLYLVAQLHKRQQLSRVQVVSSTLTGTPRLLPLAPRPLILSDPDLAHSDAAPALVTPSVLVTVPSISATATARTRKSKSQRKREDLSFSRNGTPKTQTRDTSVQRPWPRQYTTRAARFVFDPGGLVAIEWTLEDAREREPKTHTHSLPSRTTPPVPPSF